METTKLSFDQYQKETLRTAAGSVKINHGETKGDDIPGINLGAVGVAGESTELFELFVGQMKNFMQAAELVVTAGKTLDYLKKVVFHDHPIDREKVKKELGDVLWYVSVLAHMCGFSLSEIAEANVAKLRIRFPEGFDSARSMNRKPGDQ